MWHGADAGYGLLPKEPACPHARARAGWALRASSRWRIGRPGPHFYILATAPPGLTLVRGNLRMASLDHTIWFHREFRLDQWLLYQIESPSASGARGLCLGRFYTQDGQLVASVAQEGLTRVREDWK